MNKTGLNLTLLLIAYFAIQHNIINTMKRSHTQISTNKTTKQLSLKKRKLDLTTTVFLCALCNKNFTTKRNLIVHQKTHTGEKPYKCDMCDKSFGTSSNLTTHQRAHTGEKPYKCGVCDKSFSNKSNLTKHEKIHIGEKPYSCDICYKSFSQKNHLTKHEKTHTKIITPTINNVTNNLPLKSLNTPTDYRDILENIMTLNDNDTVFNEWIGQ